MSGLVKWAKQENKKRYRLRIVIPAYPAFNIYSRIARKTTALGPVTVATVAREVPGWDVEVIDENNYQRSGPVTNNGLPDHEALQKLRPADIVGFYGGLTSTIPRLYELARFYQDLSVLTIAGGQHFVGENIAEALHNGVDIVVIGEGEETIKELLKAYPGQIDKQDIAGIAYLNGEQVHLTPDRAPIKDFDIYPLPDFSLIRYAKIKIYPVGRVRGCGMNCEFCSVKGQPRYARIERLFEQISILFETRGAKKFFIVDDLFAQDRQETLRLCHLLRDYQRKINKRFIITVQIRLDKARDDELLQAMREAGIRYVAIGFESPIAEELKAMGKHLKPEEMLTLAHKFYKAGFLVHGMFIFGYPMPEGIEFTMSAPERINRFKRFINQARLHSVQVLLPAPLPGTELTQRLLRQKRIFPREYVGWEYYDGNFPLFLPDPPMTPEEMQSSLIKIMGRYYRLRHMFQIGLSILWFPILFFYLPNLKRGWEKWYRSWVNHITRFGGWLIMRQWLRNFRQDPFREKLAAAQKILSGSFNFHDQNILSGT
jgi:radical SAM superfamily enzyme YgiQ (UPF0313 family)